MVPFFSICGGVIARRRRRRGNPFGIEYLDGFYLDCFPPRSARGRNDEVDKRFTIPSPL